MYPIADFIQATMMKSGLSRGALASAMSYRNASKALRHLDRLKQDGQAPPDFQARLVVALGVDPADFDAAMEATRALQREETARQHEAETAAARMAFRPHLRVIPERRVPQPIFVAAFTGVNFWLVEQLPEDILATPLVHRLHVVGQIVRAHYAKMDGRAGPFGAIRGYLFRTEFERAIEFDSDGLPHDEHDGPVPEGRASLWCSRRRVAQG
jgi:hypothetical protein